MLTAALAAELLQVHVEYLRQDGPGGPGAVPPLPRRARAALPARRAARVARRAPRWPTRTDQARREPSDPDPLDQDRALRTHATDDIGTYESPTSGERTRT